MLEQEIVHCIDTFICHVLLVVDASPSPGRSPTTDNLLVDNLASYQNVSKLQYRDKRTSAAAEVDPNVKEKLPVPEPRTKTLAEQLDNLQVIESEAPAFHRSSKPPELPQKVLIARPIYFWLGLCIYFIVGRKKIGKRRKVYARLN